MDTKGVSFADYANKMIAKKEQEMRDQGREDEVYVWRNKISEAKREIEAANTMKQMIIMYFLILFLAWYSHSWKSMVGKVSTAFHDPAMEFDAYGLPPTYAFTGGKGGSKAMELVSAGVRTKFGVVKVYNLGFYLDEKTKQEMVTKRSLSVLASPALGGGASPSLGMLLEFERDVAKDKLAKSIVDALASKNRKKSYKMALEKFQSILVGQVEGSGLKKGERIEFIYRKKDSLCISVNSRQPECVENEDLRRRLLNVYAGEESVVPEIPKVLFTKYL